MLEPGHEERPSVGAPLVGADVMSLVADERPPAGQLQRVDVQLDLLGEQVVDGATQIEQLVHGLLPLFGRQAVGDLVDEQAVHAGVARLVDPVEAEDVPEQLVEVRAIADVPDVVELGEPPIMLVNSRAVSGEVARTAPATASRPGTRPHATPKPASNCSHARRSICWCLVASSAKRSSDHSRVSSP
jgi:hypothetical protein